MTKVEQDNTPYATFRRQVAAARKCAPAGYLTSADIKGLMRRGANLGLDQAQIDEIIALSAETWRAPKPMASSLSSRSLYR